MPISELTPKLIKRPRARTTVRRRAPIKKNTWSPIESNKIIPPSKFSWGKILWGVSILFVFFIVISLIIINRDLPTPEGLARRVVPQSTKIYDRTGKILLYDIHGAERRTSVPLSQIPHTLKLATLAAEDRTFYEHSGFRFTSMIRSVLVNILRGSKVQGGSTITQQLIKNAILGSKKTYARKVRELILAYQIEKFFSKEEILQLYFNEIPYASNAYGAEAGAQVVFGKPVNNLNLAESAILASLPKATTYYSPWGTHRDDLIKRQHYVLDAMAELGQITKPEAEKAKQFKLEFKERRESITAPHFVFYVREILTERYGEKLVNEGGLKVITTLDVTAQTQAETAIKKSYDKNLKYGATNASLVALDVPTSQILAMVGSVDYFDDKNDGQVNVALRSRQPGSSFKPIAYTAAFALGFKPETILFDVETTFKTDTKDYIPHNYDGKERGPISLRQALAGSLNIPAVKLLYLTGIDRVLELAKSLGYTTLDDRSRFGLSLVLGGAEVKLLEHTNAFTTLARDGIYKPTVSILKIEDDKGKTLEEYKESSGIEILNPEIARTTTSVLSDNQARSFIFGSS
ncbi:MAG: transglycosylase domain-containing protein, partial [Patescibacteria group bacterium]